VLNTVIAAVVTAAVAVVVVLPLAYLTSRYGGRAAGAVHTIVAGSFAVPGLLIALAVVFMTLKVPGLDFLYLTLPLLIFAYVVHFGVQALRSAEVGVATVDRRLEEAAQTLGAGRLRRLLRIEAPLMAPALAAGGGLVLLSTMKELPATLLASPVGFETLATRIWNANEDGFLADMGMASVILVAVSAVLTWLLVIRNAEHLR
ncbi:MAG: ABC transporter permease subunit, partial [Dehalococcoidia bacterium]|nr:ABC transporter permease subunit [Dehalococcoidia bacterium]